MGKPDAGNLHVRFDEGEGHGPTGPSLLDRYSWAILRSTTQNMFALFLSVADLYDPWFTFLTSFACGVAVQQFCVALSAAKSEVGEHRDLPAGRAAIASEIFPVAIFWHYRPARQQFL